jgi:hypothetical protein
VDLADGQVLISFGERCYAIPAADVERLPIDNTTAERLAEWFAGEIATRLPDIGMRSVMSITVGVEEMPGQSGWFTRRM